MIALVTGANGFIGSHLAEVLLKEGYRVRGLVRSTSDLSWLRGLRVELVYGDVTEPESLPRAVEGVSYIFHCAGITVARDPAEYYRVNLEGTRNLLEAALRYGPRLHRFVYFSSQAGAGPSWDGSPMVEDAPPHPISRYGESKLRAERAVKSFSDRLLTVILRPSSVYGPRDRMVLGYLQFLKRGVRLKLGTVQHRFNIIWIGDLVRLAVLAAQSSVPSGRVYFGADGEVYGWDDLAREAHRILGKGTIPIYLPHWLLGVYGALSERLAARPVLTRDKAREMVQRYWICSIDRARTELKFTPTVLLPEGLERTISWYRAEGWL